MIRPALVLTLVLAPFGCKLPRRNASADAGSDAAVVTAASEDAGVPGMRSIDPRKDLPLGHWETESGPKFCLSLLPDGLTRFASVVPHYRNPARVFGDIKHAEAIDADTFQITVEVSKILAKEIGSCHRHWNDYELFEAQILGQRVTSPNANGHKIPELDGGSHNEPPRTWRLTFDASRDNLEVCTTTPTPTCNKLVKRKSPSDFSRERTNAECKVDTDCVLATSGEQCDPCLCPSRPSVRSWPKVVKPEDKDKEDLSWERQPEHLCGKPVIRHEGCAECPALRVACRNKVCVVKK